MAGYATLYGDDWYLIPIRLQAGTLAQVDELVVVDDFGRATPVGAAAARDGARLHSASSRSPATPGPAAARRRCS